MRWSGVRTVMVLELRQRVRATRWRAALIVWAVVLLIITVGMLGLVAAFEGDIPDAIPTIHDLILCFVLAIGLVVAPTLSAMSINGDRADATLALLQATALDSWEIAVGKLLAAWAASLAFLATAVPFLILLTALGGSTWVRLPLNLLVLLVVLGVVCAIGLGLSAMTARTSASAVLTYLVVTFLVVGTPMVTGMSTIPVRFEQQVTVRYQETLLPGEEGQSTCTEMNRTDMAVRTDLIWWQLIPNPFVALSDVAVRTPRNVDSLHWNYSPLEMLGTSIDTIRDTPPTHVIHDGCSYNQPNTDIDYLKARPTHPAFWPITLLGLALLGVGGVRTAARRLRVPAGPLPRGVRLA